MRSDVRVRPVARWPERPSLWLSSGGQGWTATAVEKASGETKVIKSVACENIKAGNLALQEAKVLQQLDHVNIVRYIDVFLHKEKSRQELLVCTVMEHCEGGDLAKRCASWLKRAKDHAALRMGHSAGDSNRCLYVCSMSALHAQSQCR